MVSSESDRVANFPEKLATLRNRPRTKLRCVQGDEIVMAAEPRQDVGARDARCALREDCPIPGS